VNAPAEVYARRRAGFTARRDQEVAKSKQLSNARFAAFAVLLAAGVWAELRPGPVPLAVAAAAGIAFLALILVHLPVRQRQRRFDVLARLNEAGEHRLGRSWRDLQARPAPPDLSGVQGTTELNLFGSPALTQLMGPVGTPQGHDALAELLLSSDDEARIVGRQEAVRDLAVRIDFRDQLATEGLLETLPDHHGVGRFLEWSVSEARGVRLPLVIGYLVPILWLVAILTWSTGVAPSSVIGIPLLIAVALTFSGPGRVARSELTRAFGREAALRAYPRLFERAGDEPFSAPLLEETAAELRTGEFAATQQMRVLARLAHLAGLRSSGMLYVPVQLLTMWDSHVLRRVDAWRVTVGPHVGDWFRALGRIEALCAIGTLAHDHPEWTFPTIVAQPRIDAQALGHPMLDPERRVDNDVTVGPRGRFLLVTGSNMSGKSTLLRAIGLNLRLAMAGAPVCARSMTLPCVELRTSFHVEDSLADGVSLFMAQLQRVKTIVDSARDAAARGAVMVYLMDEMLAGTNTAERRIAVTRVIRHLVELGAIGAVTTHDLALANVPSLAECAVPVHFRETVHPGQEPALTFDYRIREGVATSTNALRLMEIVGLGDGADRGGAATRTAAAAGDDPGVS
jgi:hypothetical protein